MLQKTIFLHKFTSPSFEFTSYMGIPAKAHFIEIIKKYYPEGYVEEYKNDVEVIEVELGSLYRDGEVVS